MKMIQTLISIDEEIKRTYPVTKREKCCAMYKAKMNAKREALRKRLNDQQRERGICETVCEDQSQVSE
jgi:hypothetical protein